MTEQFKIGQYVETVAEPRRVGRVHGYATSDVVWVTIDGAVRVIYGRSLLKPWSPRVGERIQRLAGDGSRGYIGRVLSGSTHGNRVLVQEEGAAKEGLAPLEYLRPVLDERKGEGLGECDACGVSAPAENVLDLCDVERHRFPWLNGKYRYCAKHGKMSTGDAANEIRARHEGRAAKTPEVRTEDRLWDSPACAFCGADETPIRRIIGPFDGRYSVCRGCVMRIGSWDLADKEYARRLALKSPVRAGTPAPVAVATTLSTSPPCHTCHGPSTLRLANRDWCEACKPRGGDVEAWEMMGRAIVEQEAKDWRLVQSRAAYEGVGNDCRYEATRDPDHETGRIELCPEDGLDSRIAAAHQQRADEDAANQPASVETRHDGECYRRTVRHAATHPPAWGEGGEYEGQA